MCVCTLVCGDEGDILGSRRHTQYLVAIDLPVHLGQVAKGAGDACRKVWNIAHLHQQLHVGTSGNKGRACLNMDQNVEQDTQPGACMIIQQEGKEKKKKENHTSAK